MSKRISLAAVVITIVPVVAVSAQMAPPAPPVPPVAYGPMLVSWVAEPARCGDAQPLSVRSPDPSPSIGYGTVERPQTVTVRFRIDGTGRPLGIERVGTPYAADSMDLQPAMAAARFASGAPQEGCTVTFTAVREPLAAASVEAAWRYSLDPNGTPPGALWQRVWADRKGCTNPGPAPLLRAFPDYEQVRGTPGVRDWNMVSFDIDQVGRPVAAKVAGGSGNATLDRASVAAVLASRFEKKARTNCLLPVMRRAETLAAPEPPSEDSLRPAGATCPREWVYVRQPTLNYPEQYRKRSIEGWAVMAYDVAPWGAIGNVRILAAEPTAEFGEWAKRVMASATRPPSNTGYVGCVDRVRFKLGDQERLITSDQPVVVSN